MSSFSGVMSILRDNMSRNARIVIETPNLESPDFLLFKKFWGGLHQPRHTYLWGKSVIVEHLESMGYRNVVHYGSPQPAHWAISIQNILASKYPGLKKSFFKNGRIMGYFIIVILLLPLGLIQNLFGCESVLNVVAVKE